MKTFRKIAADNIIWAAVAIAVMLAAWQIAYACIKNDYVLPGIADTFAEFFALFGDGEFWAALGNTVIRTLCAFFISFALAALFAALSALIKPFRAMFACLISVLRTLPTMAVTLMLLIWTSPLVAPAVVTALVLFPMIYSQFAAAIDGVDKNLIEMADVYRLPPSVKLKKIILPAVAPEILSQAGSTFSLGLKVMVSAEVLSYTLSSFGGLMQQARLYSEMPRFAALTLMCILIGLMTELLSLGLRVAFSGWRIKEGSDGN